jgi:hypothetical protein
MRQETYAKKLTHDALDGAPAIQPSRELRSLVRCYFEIMDSGEGVQNPEAAQRVQDALLAAMQAERIPFNSPQEGLWIARWLYSGEPIRRGRQKTIMFARTPPHYHESEYDPIRDGVRELTALPFVDAEDERRNSARRIPVVVTVEPLHDYHGATYQSKE